MDEPVRLLVVCTGNICRSPLAERLVDVVALQHSLDVEVMSAGTLGRVGMAPPRHVVAVGREVGLDLSGHRSRAVSIEMVSWADRVLVMEPEHSAFLGERFADALGDKVVPLGPLVGRERIDDPYGAWFRSPYRRMRDELTQALERFVGGLRR